MLRAVYRALWWIVAPAAVLRLFWRSRRERGYREHIGERFGHIAPAMRALRGPDDPAPLIWVHAVSVGETRAAQPLIDAGKLLPLFEARSRSRAWAESEPMEIYACVAERAALNAKVRAFVDFVEAELAEHAPGRR